jgi:hypothetical protein
MAISSLVLTPVSDAPYITISRPDVKQKLERER